MDRTGCRLTALTQRGGNQVRTCAGSRLTAHSKFGKKQQEGKETGCVRNGYTVEYSKKRQSNNTAAYGAHRQLPGKRQNSEPAYGARNIRAIKHQIEQENGFQRIQKASQPPKKIKQKAPQDCRTRPANSKIMPLTGTANQRPKPQTMR